MSLNWKRRVWCHRLETFTKNVPVWYCDFSTSVGTRVNAMERQNHLIVVVSCFKNGQTAIIAMIGPGKRLWKLTHEEIDRNEEHFTLYDIANDGHCFYVLNGAAGCVYLISAKGQVLTKVLENLPEPSYLSINAETNKMVVACKDKHIKVYELVYSQTRDLRSLIYGQFSMYFLIFLVYLLPVLWST